MSGTTIDKLHTEWLKRPGYREAYDALGEEFSMASALIEARAKAGLTQEQLAERMHTTQTVIARLESGRVNAVADFIRAGAGAFFFAWRD